jgi:hypothetical protein
LRDQKDAMDGVPMLRAWMPERRTPGPGHVAEQGRWIAEPAWPTSRIAMRDWHLGAGVLGDTPVAAAVPQHRSPQSLGETAPEWLSMGIAGEVPQDQRADDGRSLCFDSAALASRIEIFGVAELDIDLSVDRPTAMLVARLCDVAPDGTSLRVSLGVLNLTHRDGHAAVKPMVPGARTRIRLRFPDVAHAFKPGHRIRLALSTAYWPVLWPSPEPVTLTVHTATSRLALPVRPADPPGLEPPRFAPPEAGPPTAVTVLEPARMTRTQRRDLASGEITYLLEAEGGYLGPGRRWRIDETGTILGHRITRRFVTRDDDPLAARGAIEETIEIERGDWRVRLETATRMHATATEFHVACEARAFEGEREAINRRWTFVVPRHGT